jgi:two-component system response regulator MprA
MKSANNQQFSVVIAEDDPSVRKAVERVLELEGYSVTAVNDGQAALDTILAKAPHAAVLDVSMPFLDGLSVCKELRHRGNRTPILLLTARHEVGDRVAGLDAGADDYLVKPFSVRELILRIQSELRKSQRTSPLDGPDLRVGTLELFRNQHLLRSGSRSITLDPPEVLILALLMSNPGQLLKADTLAEKLRSAQEPGSRITTDIRHRMEALREKVALLEDRLVCDPRAGYGISC